MRGWGCSGEGKTGGLPHLLDQRVRFGIKQIRFSPGALRTLAPPSQSSVPECHVRFEVQNASSYANATDELLTMQRLLFIRSFMAHAKGLYGKTRSPDAPTSECLDRPGEVYVDVETMDLLLDGVRYSVNATSLGNVNAATGAPTTAAPTIGSHRRRVQTKPFTGPGHGPGYKLDPNKAPAGHWHNKVEQAMLHNQQLARAGRVVGKLKSVHAGYEKLEKYEKWAETGVETYHKADELGSDWEEANTKIAEARRAHLGTAPLEDAWVRSYTTSNSTVY